MPVVLITADIFHMGVFKGPAAPAYPKTFDQEGDRDGLFLILQPLIFTGATPLATLDETVWRHQHLSDYFTATGPTLGSAGTPVMMGSTANLTGAGWPSRGDWLAAAATVPFPPRTAFDLELAITSDGDAAPRIWRYSDAIPDFVTAANPAAGDPGLLLDRADWPPVAIQSFIQPKIDDFALLRPKDQAEVRDWLVSAIGRLRPDKSDPPLTPWQTNIRNSWIVGDPVFGPEDPASSPDAQVTRWRNRLESAPALTRSLYKAFITPDPDAPADHSKPNVIYFEPPRFKYGPDWLPQPEILFPDVGGQPVQRGSYHHLLWEGIRAQVAAGPDQDQKTREALHRLYGLGERLRWLDAARQQSPDRFMVLDNQSGRLANGLGTNAQSLAGQVFRIGDLTRPIRQVQINRFLINGTEPVWQPTQQATPAGGAPTQAAARTQFAQGMVAFSDQVAAHAADTFEVKIRPDPANPDGLIMFQPKLATLLPEPLGQGLELPRSLLDNAERLGATETPWNAPRLVVEYPPRTGLKIDELLGGSQFLDGTGSRLTSIFKTRIRLVRRLRFGAGHAPTGGSTAPYIYDVAMAEALADDEAALVMAVTAGDPAQVRQRVLALWIPQQNGAAAVIALTAPLKRLPPDALHPLPIMRITDGSAIDVIDQALKNLPQALKSDQGFAVHLTVANLLPSDPFNVVPSVPNDRKLVGLTTRFTLKSGQSADLLATRLEAAFDPPPLTATDPVLVHFANFTKLRVASLFNQKWTLLTYPDALAPLRTPADPPLNPGDPPPDPINDPLNAGPLRRAAKPFYSFALVHHFDQELDDGSNDQGATARTAEANRYSFVCAGGGAGSLGGYIEHQYSVRLALAPQTAPAVAVYFSLEHPIRNCADVRSELHTPASRATGSEKRQTILLLGYSCDVPHNTLTLSFDSALLRQLFANTWGGTTQRNRLDGYRQIYEAFADLRMSLAAGLLKLRLEAWVFDNSLANPQAAEAPDFLRSMRCLGRAELTMNAIATLALDIDAAIACVLGADFSAFTTNVDALASGNATFPPIHPVPLNDPAWRDEAGQAFDPSTIMASAHVVRAGLNVTRPSSAPPSANTANGRYLPLPLSDELRAMSLWSPAAGATGYEGLAVAAKTELQELLTPGSELFQRMSWMICRDRIDPNGQAAFESSMQLHFGQAASSLFVAPQKMPDIRLVSDLYYTPFGFLPLAKHPDLSDMLVTFEFASWLCRLVQAILDGTSFPALALSAPVSAQDAEAERQAVEDLVKLPGGIADQITALVLRVDDPGAIDKTKADALYQRVNGLLQRLDPNSPGDFRSALSARFTATPADFANLRGVGIALFDPDRFNTGLYSVRINKRVREDLADANAVGAPRSDADDFHFTAVQRDTASGLRFVIDGLDEATYDAEFTIEQNRYLENGAIIGDHRDVSLLGEERMLGPQLRVALRGDVQARTAEDVIEADLDPTNPARRYQADSPMNAWAQDPPAAATNSRQLEVNAVHFNPSWRIKRGGFVTGWQYLLPSRRPPSQPVIVTPRAVAGAIPDLDPRVSTIRVGPGEDPTNPAIFVPRATDALKKRKTVIVDLAGSKAGAAALTLTAVDGYRAVVGQPAMFAGWQRYDTVLAHHYFMIEADPDATPADITQDDAILIETSADEGAVALPVALPRSGGLQESALYAWFWWDRLRSVSGANAQMPATRPDLDTVVNELHQAFDFDRIKHTKGPNSLLRPADASPSLGGVYSFFPDATGKGYIVPPVAPTSDVIGGVVAVDIMHVDSDPDVNGQVVRYAVRVTTLETPLTRTRVRLRVLRNYRDVDADLHNDIAQAFLMTSPFSEWSERTDRAVKLTPADFIAMRAERGWTLDTSVKLADWLSIDTSKPAGDPSLVRDFGPVLQTLIRATTPANPQCRLWGPEAENETWRIYGVVQDVGRDAHVILKGGDLDRSERVRRQILVAKSGAGPVTWSSVGDLTAALDRKKIVSARFEISFVWQDSKARTVMELTFPVRFART